MEKFGLSDRDKAEIKWLLVGFSNFVPCDRLSRHMLFRDLDDEWAFATANPQLVEVAHI